MELKKCPSPYTLRKQLACLPKGLYETYDRILLGLDEDCRSDIQIFLCWLAFSTRPLTLEEVAETVAVRLNSGDRPVHAPDRRYQDPRDVLEKCSSLITDSEGSPLRPLIVVCQMLSVHI